MQPRRTDRHVAPARLSLRDVIITFIAVSLFSKQSHCRVVLTSPKPPVSSSDDKTTGCTFPATGNETSEMVPLLVNRNPSFGVRTFHYPQSGEDFVHIAAGQDVIVLCPGKGNRPRDDQSNSKNKINSAAAICHGNDVVTVSSNTVKSQDVLCTKPPRSSAKRSNNLCAGNNTEILIGFELDEAEFLPTISSCFDENTKATLFSSYIIRESIASYAKRVQRPPFDESDFYEGFPVNDVYKQTNQLKTLGKILKSDDLARKYIQPNSKKKFLSRGHLAAKADFIFAAEQKATFYYINAAPQWMAFNGGNWNALESSIRKLVGKLGRDLIAYTGTYDVTTLPDIDGHHQELYLYIDENNNRAVPVPKLFWKLVYDPKTRAGVVVVGVNNPYLNPVPKDYILCESICSELSWIKFNVNNVNRGFVYCCSVSDFRKAVGYIPDLPVRSVLS